MKYVLAVRALEDELYNRLPSGFLVLNFCFSYDDYYSKENVINIDMNDYGVFDSSYTLLRNKGLESIVTDNVDKDDVLFLYVKDLSSFDKFINITNDDYFLSEFMYKRRHLNYYLYRIPDIFESNEDFRDNLNMMMEYGNVVPVRILRNFLLRNKETTKRILAVNVANTILNVVDGNKIKRVRKRKNIYKVKSNVSQMRFR